MNPFYHSKSFRPYFFIISASLLILGLGFISNSGAIGALFGSTAANVNFRYNPCFVIGVLAIFCIRKPYIAIVCTMVFAVLYQIYMSEFSGVWQMLGVEKPSYFNFSRIFGGVLLLACIGLFHFIIVKLNNVPETTGTATDSPIAEQIGLALNNSLRPAFAYTRYLSSEYQFHPPAEIFKDAYVLGFLYGQVTLFIRYDFNGEAMSAEKKGEIIVSVWKYVCPDTYMEVAQAVNTYAATYALGNISNIKNGKDFKKGMEDAETMYGAATGRLKPDDPAPILNEAKKLAVECAFGDENPNVALGGAVSLLTINKHIKEKYLASSTTYDWKTG